MAKKFLYDDVPPVKTTGGLVKGYCFDGVYTFKGIPYAHARRFHRPEPAVSWEGIRPATSYGPVAPLMQDFIDDEIRVPHRHWVQDENCQNLNIWTPELESGCRPVMVWIHGGGYISGSSIEQLAYDGHHLSQFGDVVVVSINHRLNVLGYLDLSAFGEQYADSGNAGNEDIIAALRWVRDNIAAFGGDAGNVTVLGQSGGGMKILDLMQMPAADGLFHKAVVMSGVNAGVLSPIPYGSGEKLIRAILRELNIPEGNVEALEIVPHGELVRAYMKECPALYLANEYFGGGPQKNEYYCGVPSIHGFRPNGMDIPVMFGSVICEFDKETGPEDRTLSDESAVITRLQAKFGSRAQNVLTAFQKAYPEKHPTVAMGVDRVIRQETVRLAKMRAAQFQAPVYVYNFTLDFPIENNKPAWHCADIPFVFHNTELVEVSNIPGVTEDLEEKICSSIVAFAKTGDPNSVSLPYWPSATADSVPTMIFDRECLVRRDYDDELYQVIDEVLPPFTFADMIGASMELVSKTQ